MRMGTKGTTTVALASVGIAFLAACGGSTPTPPPAAAPAAPEPAPPPVEALAPGDSYTCSMHADVRAGAPGRCPQCGMDLVPVAAADTGAVADTAAAETPAAAPSASGHGHQGHSM